MYPASHLFLLAMWRFIPDEEDVDWIDLLVENPGTQSQWQDKGILVKKMLDLGMTKSEVARFAKIVGFEMAQDICLLLDDSTIVEDLPEEAGWGLFECEGDDDIPVSRMGLDYDLVNLDPSRRLMKPRKEEINQPTKPVSSPKNMITVYEVTRAPDVGIITLAEGVPIQTIMFDATRQGESWQPQAFFFCTYAQKTNFVGGMGMKAFYIDDETKRILSSQVDLSFGELLPISVEGEDYWILNITNIVDALDEAHSLRRIYLVEPAFYRHKLKGELSPFLLGNGEPKCFVVQDESDPDYKTSFFYLYHALGLTGLAFKKVWQG